MIPFLFEPHNPWDKTPKKKKHLCQQIEEEQLMARIIAEQAAQAAAQQIQNQANAAAGAGGIPPWDYFNIGSEVADFSYSPTGNVAAPVTYVFANLTPSPEYDTFAWDFGDGTTSTLQHPTHFYSNTGSVLGLISASLVVTYKDSSTDTVVKMISASVPVVTSLFTTASVNGDLIGPVTLSFTNSSTNTSYQPTSSYLWVFGDGTSSSLQTPANHVYSNTGSFTASLQATGSFGLSSLRTSSFFATAPTLNSTFSVVTSSRVAPTTVTLSSSVIYNGHGTVTGTWYEGEYSGSEAQYNHTYVGNSIIARTYNTRSQAGTPSGSFTASLNITESSYGFTSIFTSSFPILLPSIVTYFTASNAAGTVTITGFTASFTSSNLWVSSSTSPGTLTGMWIFGDGTSSSFSGTEGSSSFTHSYSGSGRFTASLSVTESNYKIVSNLYTSSFSQSVA